MATKREIPEYLIGAGEKAFEKQIQRKVTGTTFRNIFLKHRSDKNSGNLFSVALSEFVFVCFFLHKSKLFRMLKSGTIALNFHVNLGGCCDGLDCIILILVDTYI